MLLSGVFVCDRKPELRAEVLQLVRAVAELWGSFSVNETLSDGQGSETLTRERIKRRKQAVREAKRAVEYQVGFPKFKFCQLFLSGMTCPLMLCVDRQFFSSIFDGLRFYFCVVCFGREGLCATKWVLSISRRSSEDRLLFGETDGTGPTAHAPLPDGLLPFTEGPIHYERLRAQFSPLRPWKSPLQAATE